MLQALRERFTADMGRCVQRFGCLRNSCYDHDLTSWKKAYRAPGIDWLRCMSTSRARLLSVLWRWAGEKPVVKRSRVCARCILGGCVTLNLLQQACYVCGHLHCVYIDDIRRRYPCINRLVHQNATDWKPTSIYSCRIFTDSILDRFILDRRRSCVDESSNWPWRIHLPLNQTMNLKPQLHWPKLIFAFCISPFLHREFPQSIQRRTKTPSMTLGLYLA